MGPRYYFQSTLFKWQVNTSGQKPPQLEGRLVQREDLHPSWFSVEMPTAGCEPLDGSGQR